MNILMLVIHGCTAEQLLIDEVLANLRRLMEMGTFGRVASQARDQSPAEIRQVERDIWEGIIHNGRSGLWLAGETLAHPKNPDGEILVTGWTRGNPAELSRGQFLRALAWMKTTNWGACLIEDHGLELLEHAGEIEQYLHRLDENTGLLFEGLTNETLVAVLSRRAGLLNAYILAAPFAEPENPESEAQANDVAATLLALCGLVDAGQIPGRQLLTPTIEGHRGGDSLSQDEEALLRERLSGLGYL